MRLACLFSKEYLLLDLASGRMYTILALSFFFFLFFFAAESRELFPSSVFSSVAVLNKILCFTQGPYADFFLATSRQSKDHKDARTLCDLLDR